MAWYGTQGGNRRPSAGGEIMIDQFEAMEEAAERWADENLRGDNFICDCGMLCKLDAGVYVSANPYAPPICPVCASGNG